MTWQTETSPLQDWDKQPAPQQPWAVIDPNANTTLWDSLLGGTLWDGEVNTIWDLSLVDQDDWIKQ